jgi:predicted NUDIX family NTP pyrophosphohydrolase
MEAVPRVSAGLLLYRRRNGLEVFLVHPGGPFFRNKDDGAWSLPKGEIEEGDEPVATALREFSEETGFEPPSAEPLPLGEIRQKGGKRVLAWAVEGDCDPARFHSNRFEIEWPPGSGRKQSFPEIDRAGFFTPDAARRKLNPAQAELVARLEEKLTAGERA